MADEDPMTRPTNDFELANGKNVSVREAVACFKFVEMCHRHDRATFDTLLAMAGFRGSPIHEKIDELRTLGICRPDGSLKPIYQEVLICSVVDHGNNEFELIEPYHVERPKDHQLWQTEEMRLEKNLLIAVAGFGKSSPGRPR